MSSSSSKRLVRPVDKALNDHSNTAMKPVELKLSLIFTAHSARAGERVFSYSQAAARVCFINFRNCVWRNSRRDQFSAHRVKLKYL